MKVKAKKIAERLQGEFLGSEDKELSSVKDIKSAEREDLTFITGHNKYLESLRKSNAGAVLTSKQINDLAMPQIVVKDVNKALIEAMHIFAPELKKPQPGIDETAKVSENANIGEGCSIGPFTIIWDGAEIGENTVISGGCTVGENTKIGNHCRIDDNVVIYHNCILGNNINIKANSTIGGDGFGYEYIEGAHRHIPHNGNVVIEDFVDIGSGTCIDRAKFGSTIIGAGTKIDNLVQIGHNAKIGKLCLIVGQAGIAGSTEVGNGVVLGGQSGLIDNIKIADKAIICAGSIAYGDVNAGEVVAGTPAIDRMEHLRSSGLLRKLPEMKKDLKKALKRIERLETSENNKK